jgi:hypothetical protein
MRCSLLILFIDARRTSKVVGPIDLMNLPLFSPFGATLTATAWL